MWKGGRAAFDVLGEQVDAHSKYIWVHAASLGEFEQGRPLIEYLKKEHPEYKILLTFFSPSGYEVRKNYEGADIICYLPLDTRSNARRFLSLVHPCMAFFIKYEFWYNYLHILKQRQIPVYSVSSIFRPTQVFFQWYGRRYSRVLHCFTHFFVQNEESRALLAEIGISNVTISGDTRFDRVQEIASKVGALPILSAFAKDASVFVAGSSWQPDERVFIPYFNGEKRWKVILAPHVVDEGHLQEIEQQLARPVVRYSKSTPALAEEADYLIIDGYGLLSSVYRYGTVAYIGGGFGTGVHNVLEAAVWQIPVIFGPNNGRFMEIQQLKHCGGGFEIKDEQDFGELMQKIISQPGFLQLAGEKAGGYVRKNAGAIDVIVKKVFGDIKAGC